MLKPIRGFPPFWSAGVVSTLVVMFFAVRPIDAVTVTNVSWDSTHLYNRFVIHFDEPVTYNPVDQTKEKGIFYIDIYGLGMEYRRRVIDINDGILAKVDAITYRDFGVLRLVFYPLDPANTFAVKQVSNPPRLVVDTVRSQVRPTDTHAAAPLSRGRTTSLFAAGPIQRATDETSLPVLGSLADIALRGGKKKVVIIDPGHGGANAGTRSAEKIGGREVLEKELTLQFAVALKRVIDQSPGNLVAILTRTGDETLSLRDRTRFAEENNGDLFLSIHMNDGAGNPNARGFEVFFLNDKGATDEATRELERRENIDISGPEAAGARKPIVLAILSEVERVPYEVQKRESRAFCVRLMHALSEIPFYRSLNRGIKEANFAVLRTPKMPSVLLEMGFLTNKQDTQYLINPRFQHATAVAIYNAINHYFASVDPDFKPHRLDVAAALDQ
jgi:N-acetylmuramoyl-L-alanine amidase